MNSIELPRMEQVLHHLEKEARTQGKNVSLCEFHRNQFDMRKDPKTDKTNQVFLSQSSKIVQSKKIHLMK